MTYFEVPITEKKTFQWQHKTLKLKAHSHTPKLQKKL